MNRKSKHIRKWIFTSIFIFFLLMSIFMYIHWTHERLCKEMQEYISNEIENLEVQSLEQPEPEVIIQEKMVLADNMDYLHYTRILLGVKNIPQNPELPTGCEITSLAIVINYLNPETECDKLNLADNFLKQGEIGKTNPDDAFIGNPRNRYSFGANAPVLVNAAEKYYSTVGIDRKIENITGADVDDLMDYIISGYPIMVWGTINMAESHISVQWEIDGETVPWHSNFHCLVLIGFDMEKQVYYFADPLKEEITEYDMSVFKDRYEAIGKQAIVIY